MTDTGQSDVFAAHALAGEGGGLACDVTGEGALSLGVVLPIALLVGWLLSRAFPEAT